MVDYFTTSIVYLLLFTIGIQSSVQCFFLLKILKIKQTPIHYILYTLVGYTLFYLGIILPPMSDSLGLLLAVLSIFLFTRFILKQNLSVSVFLAFLIMTVNILAESILTPLLSIFVRINIVSELLLDNISIWGFILLSIAVFSICTKFFAIDETIKSKVLWILSTPLLFICLVLRPYFSIIYPNLYRYGLAINDTILNDDIWFLFISLAAMLTVGSILFTYKKLISQSKIENDAILLSTKIAAQKSYIEEIKQRYDATNRFRHDFKNHISILSGLINERDFAKANDYLSRFNDCYEDMTFQIATGNTTLDILLSEKLHIAKQNGILLKIDIDICDRVRMDDFDLCTVFANVLDNAIKGCKYANDKYIDIVAKKNKDFFVIDIINSFNIQKYQRGSGIGLETIKFITEKYKGYLDVSTEDQVFRVSIMWSII